MPPGIFPPAHRRGTIVVKVYEADTLAFLSVALAGLPPLLHGIVVRLVADQNDMQIVGEFADHEELLALEGESAPDVLVVGTGNGEINGVCTQLLTQYPQAKVVAVGADGRRVLLYDLRPHKITVDEVSSEELLEVIRSGVLPAKGRGGTGWKGSVSG